MARYRIDRACGHQETVQLPGKGRERDRRAAREQSRPCRECWHKEREEESRAAAEAAERDGLSRLQGPPRAVAWAATIRQVLLTRLEKYVADLQHAGPDRSGHGAEGGGAGAHSAPASAPAVAEAGRTALAAVREISTAGWFIDHRDVPPPVLVTRAGRGEFVPRTREQKAAGFDPHGYNTVTLPEGEVRPGRDGDAAVVTLRCSRWEGCTFTHPAALTTVRAAGTGPQERAGVVELRFHGGWRFAVSDGRRTLRVPAQEMHADRTTGRRDGPGPRHYLLPAPWREGAWNEIDVPAGDVDGEAFTAFGERRPGWVRVTLRRSRWEGLHLHHRGELVVRHRPGFVTLLVPPDMPQVWLRGGVGRTVVPAAELAGDRARPLHRPGESLAVPQERWHRVVFDPSRVRRVKDVSMCRFGWETGDPRAVVFHRMTMCRTREDGTVAWHFPGHWEFRLHLPQGGTRTLSATQFVEATADWALTEPAPGTHRRVPEPLDPVVAEIDDELLDDLGIPEEWDLHDGPDPGDGHPAPAAAAPGDDTGRATADSSAPTARADHRPGTTAHGTDDEGRNTDR
ncbi:hypothetical protein [Streptomyces yaizuensis]|uniref:Uncharacterized protein n=1 Tax=Streptomyces yaizuensis TaxID=2989713 RepID=A0ABQ5P6G4_9ACTN|nr:hypothetical protein [Streptomyces sp. YSPA8]GLF98171.1 hypothetical protein SYYSPA8_27760 [Streptomyces sp. YSPA8]